MIEILDAAEKNPTEKDEESQSINELSPSKGPIFRTEITVDINASNESSDGNEELVILKDGKRSVINRSAYSKLHKLSETSENRLSSASLSKFEDSDISDLNRRHPAHRKIGTKNRSWSSFEKLSKIPVAKSKKPKNKRPNELSLTSKSVHRSLKANKFDELMKKNSDDEANDYVPCVIRSESIETVYKIEKELSNFIMDNKKKDKKRTSSFRKLFSVPFFGKDKKKKDKESEVIHQPSSDYVDNYQNETNSNAFMRNSSQRHTVGCDHLRNRTNFAVKRIDAPAKIEEDPPPEIMRQYANSHINKFNKIRQSFESPDDNKSSNLRRDDFVSDNIQNIPASHITKYIDTSSSTSTLESQKQRTYQNALIAQAEFQQAKQERGMLPIIDDKTKLTRNDSLRRETPPRAQDTYQPVNIVKPKARLPISSGRPLPNPYHYEIELKAQDNSYHPKTPPNITYSEKEETSRPQFNEIYGTVLDAIDYNNRNSVSKIPSQDSGEQLSPVPRSPRSPSLEMSKLRLAPDREILQPRIRSPLHSTRVSTEKMIATELLKNTSQNNDESDSRILKSTNSVPAQCPPERFNSPPQAESTPETKSSVSDAINALRNKLEANDQNLKLELNQIRSTLQNLKQNDTLERNSIPRDDASQATNSPRGTLMTSSRSSVTISPLPATLTSEASLSSTNQRNWRLPSPEVELRRPPTTPEVELRQKNPVGRQLGSQSLSHSPSSPSKDEIRRSVEAYYWKEIKRIKEKEDYEIYLSHLHYSQGGYAEDPIFTRRSRGMEDNRSRRSSSVPRNARQNLSFDNTTNSNMQHFAIPEGSTIVYNPQGSQIYGYLPPRIPQLETIPKDVPDQSVTDSKMHNSGDYGTYKPIFRRGSLSSNVHQPVPTNKKVSFSSTRQPENSPAWPTKNGFTKSPPQRKLERVSNNTLEDDVFLPPAVQHPPNVPYQSINGEHQRPRNNYSSDTESVYGVAQSRDIYAYNLGQMQYGRTANYNSDSEAVYGKQRRYKTLSQQDLENLRNAQSKGNYPTNVQHRPVPRLTRHESIQLPEPPYGYAVQYGTNRGGYRPMSNRGNYSPANQNRMPQNSLRRDILITDNIYGHHIRYSNDPVGTIYGYTNNQINGDPVYVSRSKQVTVRNKVCDMYGRIHDSDIQATGVLMGQLQNSPTSPPNFRRGTRLTASNNDMLQRRRLVNYEHYDANQRDNVSQTALLKAAPIRPLPPLPPNGKMGQNEKKNNSNSSRKKRK